MNCSFRQSTAHRSRRGATLVETAWVLPVFFTLFFAFVEFGHVFLTIHSLNSAARRAARLGVGEDSTTSVVVSRAQEILDTAIGAGKATVMVKDASSFDEPGFDASSIDYDELPDAELSDLDRRELFVVRVTVPYNDVGIMGPRWLTSLNLYGQCVMRKE